MNDEEIVSSPVKYHDDNIGIISPKEQISYHNQETVYHPVRKYTSEKTLLKNKKKTLNQPKRYHHLVNHLKRLKEKNFTLQKRYHHLVIHLKRL